MLTLETLSEQGARLAVRDRLWLIWRLVRSLFARSLGEVGGAINSPAAALDDSLTEQTKIFELFGTIDYDETYDYKAQRDVP